MLSSQSSCTVLSCKVPLKILGDNLNYKLQLHETPLYAVCLVSRMSDDLALVCHLERSTCQSAARKFDSVSSKINELLCSGGIFASAKV